MDMRNLTRDIQHIISLSTAQIVFNFVIIAKPNLKAHIILRHLEAQISGIQKTLYF